MDQGNYQTATAEKQAYAVRAGGQIGRADAVQNKESTAAQDALTNVEVTKERAINLANRLSRVASNLGVSLPQTDSANKPRAVRPGIIGSIYETTKDLSIVIESCHEFMSQIERQV